MDSPVSVCSLILSVHVDDENFFYIDVDECMENSDRCAHNCQNTEGSYTCNCSEGFLLNNDGYSCIGMYACLSYLLPKCYTLNS